MRMVKKYWMVLLLGGLLMATLVGVAGARPNDRPTAAISRRITVPSGHFYPREDGTNWYSAAAYIESKTDGSPEYFHAPVVFPTGQSVVVESVTLNAFDNNASDDMCVELRKVDTAAGTHVMMADVCSSGATLGVRSFSESSIDNNPVKHGKGIYLWLRIDDNTSLDAHGVKIQYHHGTT